MGVKEISPLKQPPLPPTGKGADLNSGFTSTKQKKRGAGKSAQRANAWRNAKHIDMDFSSNISENSGA